MFNLYSVNYMTKTYNSLLNSYVTNKYSARDVGFADTVKHKIAERAAQTAEAPSAAQASRDGMTMEEYKQFIYEKISQIPIHPSQAGWNWNIEITDEGFEAMKNDLAYEEHVLKSIRVNFSAVDPFGSSNYSILHFGATEEESYGVGWGMGNSALQKSESSFWERREERRKKWEELYDEWLEKRAAAIRWQREQFDQAIGVRNAEKQHSMNTGNGEEKIRQAADVYEPNLAAMLMNFVGGDVTDD